MPRPWRGQRSASCHPKCRVSRMAPVPQLSQIVALLPSQWPSEPLPRFPFREQGGTWMGTHGRPVWGAGHVTHLGPPASCRAVQPGASQADTMGRTHVRFVGEENYSLWTKRSGQDIYNCFKKSPICSPSLPKHFRNVAQQARLFKYPNPE